MKVGEIVCPHDKIQHCPLYVESHNCRGLGCVDDLAEPCKVKRGDMKYGPAVAALRAVDPQLVAQCEFAEDSEFRKAQHARNLQLNGIH